MADVSFSAGSDEECEILVGMVHDRLPREYAHQPIRIVESETSDENNSTTASEEESTAEEATENRLASVNTWCRCGMCESETLGDEKEAICCLEVPNCVKMIAAVTRMKTRNCEVRVEVDNHTQRVSQTLTLDTHTGLVTATG
ncbi:hypothetical protein CAPTEDRAFT_203645 [Capitella teleta]|uniref:Uncharacterized protein n=1 Tax=Capitella teleta TaxID=283909 RepID=R7T7F0_CAPTE|nr:hypothetical protein CAPTEDRAFT_203645 [Capitella teleta]|eukprot:ELT89530.1 hypothetical protein CAPTEDRAFT_203645 [Capitella teleta]